MEDVRIVLTVEHRQQNLTTRWSEPRLSRRFHLRPTLKGVGFFVVRGERGPLSSQPLGCAINS